MKLLVINPFGVGTYNEKIGNICKKVVRPGTEVVVENNKRGIPFIRHAYFQMLMVPDVVERIYQAEKEGFDGVFVSCCFEPGVKEAREIVDIPVVGGSLPGVFLARQLGQKFGFITDTKRADAQTYDLFKQFKLDVEMVRLDSVSMGAEEVAINPQKNYERVIELARKMVSEGADVIVNGCTVVSAYFSEQEVPNDLKRIPIIDSNVASIKTLEMLVDLHKTLGITVSRNIYYQKPQEIEDEAFCLVRKVYGVETN